MPNHDYNVEEINLQPCEYVDRKKNNIAYKNEKNSVRYTVEGKEWRLIYIKPLQIIG